MFLAELSKSLPGGIQTIDKTANGGNGRRHTWVHPRIATNIAAWVSPKFASDITKWIEMAKNDMPHINYEYFQSLEQIKPFVSKDDTELVVQRRLCSNLKGGRMEVPGNHGPIDIVSDTEVIEVKHAPKYTHALGQVLGHGESFPTKTKRIHLFGNREELQACRMMLCVELCSKFGVSVSFEEVDDE